jgi:uncharacterized protein
MANDWANDRFCSQGRLTMTRKGAAVWNPYLAGIALGFVLFATFFVTGHGLGVSGATTSLTAVGAAAVAPNVVAQGSYLSGYAHAGLNGWIDWEVLGLVVGALAGCLVAARFDPMIDGPTRLGPIARLGLALVGGTVTGFGARMAMGCTSGMGLSGSAPLAAAGFLFLMGFFGAGLLAGFAMKPLWRGGE